MPLRTESHNSSDRIPIFLSPQEYLEAGPNPPTAASSLYSRSPNVASEAEVRRSSGFSSFRDLLAHGRWGDGNSANSSISHLPLTGSASQDHFWHAPETVEQRAAASSSEDLGTSILQKTIPAALQRPPIPTTPHLVSLVNPVEIVDLESQDRTHDSSFTEGRQRRRRRRRRNGAWVRPPNGCSLPFAHGDRRKTKISCVISGLLLCAVASVYLALALTMRQLGPEFHILMIVTVVFTAAFFIYSLLRYISLRLRQQGRCPRSHRSDGSGRQGSAVHSRRIRIPGKSGPEGYAPKHPIQVLLASDEEIRARREDGFIEPEKLEILKAPPPAYGLWRCSVRANPSLLHWQRVDNYSSPSVSEASSPVSPVDMLSTQGHLMRDPTLPGRLPEMQERSSSSATLRLRPIAETAGPQTAVNRPPSYMTDDGVEYLLAPPTRTFSGVEMPDELPREGEVHPAFRGH